MNMPGFTAEAALEPPSQFYRASAGRNRPRGSRTAVAAMADLIMLDAYGTRSNAGYVDAGPEDACEGLKKCCAQGYVDCCIAYRKSCL